MKFLNNVDLNSNEVQDTGRVNNTTASELSYLEGLTGSIQTQLNNKENLPIVYTTKTEVTEGYYRIATIPIGTQYKQAIFRIKGYTATRTTTESTITVNLGYYSGNYGSQGSAILCNTSHSFNSETNAENGWVFRYCRVSFDATSAYIDMYKYKTTAVTIETQPLTLNDWVWATGSLAVNPTVGSYRNITATMGAGTYGNNINANSANSSAYTGYSQYGVHGSNTLSNTTNKTGQWMYFGYCNIDYNSGYLCGRSFNLRVRLQEMSYDGTATPNEMDDFIVNVQVNLGYHADATAFNALVPTIGLNIEGQTSLTESDICALVSASSTTSKTIRFYVKLKGANTTYNINPEQRYGRAFRTSTFAQTQSYLIFTYAGDQTPLVSLPTPAQGSVVYATFRPLKSPVLTGIPTAPTAPNGTNTAQIATTEFVQNAVSASGDGDMLKTTYDPTNKNSDAFNMDNMTSGVTNKVVTESEKTTWNSKQDALPTGTTSQFLRGDKTWQAVTKTNVGLGSVQDYGVATQAEAQAGISTAKYMTPLRTAEAIAALSPAKFMSGTGTFPAGTTYTITDAFITADTLVTVSPTGDKTQNWSVVSNNGNFVITAEAAEPSSVTFDWGAVK